MKPTGTFLRHFRNPSNVGSIDGADARWQKESPHCMDRIRFSLSLNGDTVADIRFLARGCGVTIVSASILTDYVKGREIQEILQCDVTSLREPLGSLPRKKERCFSFVWQSLREGLAAIESDGKTPHHEFEEIPANHDRKEAT